MERGRFPIYFTFLPGGATGKGRNFCVDLRTKQVIRSTPSTLHTARGSVRDKTGRQVKKEKCIFGASLGFAPHFFEHDLSLNKTWIDVFGIGRLVDGHVILYWLP
jgi:hypothetical protein